MNPELRWRLLQSTSSVPSDEETVQAILTLVRLLMPRPADTGLQAGTAPPDPWMTLPGAAEYAAVSEDTLREWISSGQLCAGRVGRVIRIRRSNIDALLSGPSCGVSAEGEVRGTDVRVEGSSDTSRAILTALRHKRGAKL